MGTPLDSLKIPESNWEYSEILRDSLTALAWGLDIEEFWAMPPQKRALLTGTVVVKSQMQSYEEKLSSADLKHPKGKPKK